MNGAEKNTRTRNPHFSRRIFKLPKTQENNYELHSLSQTSEESVPRQLEKGGT